MAGTFGGGSGGGRPSMLSRIHLPRVTGDVRVDTEVIVRKLPCARIRPSLWLFDRDAAELFAVNTFDTVVLSDTLIHERIVRIEYVEHAAIFAHD